ncbi:MAG: hypothetical protein AB7T06_07150 [Kofleriaceae bacterium]
MSSPQTIAQHLPANDCVPGDRFFQADQWIAEQVWSRGDNGTVSQRIAELVNAKTGAPIQTVKTILHGVLAGGVAVVTALLLTRVTNAPVLGLVGAALASGKTFQYLQQDRCGQRRPHSA